MYVYVVGVAEVAGEELPAGPHSAPGHALGALAARGGAPGGGHGPRTRRRKAGVNKSFNLHEQIDLNFVF